MAWIDDVKTARAEGSFEKAMNVLSAELGKRPNDPMVHYQMAWTHDALGKEMDAVSAYERAIELGLSGEDLKGAYLGLGSTYRALGKYEKSKEVFDRAIKQFPNYRAFQVFIGLTLFNLGKQADAMEILIRQLAETSSDESIKKYEQALLFYSNKLSETFE
ncbi:MAG: tetratricopeptide repeat protein [Pseudobdellovibrionaceae bacterium]